MNRLWKAGWFGRNYHQGEEKPYDVTLSERLRTPFTAAEDSAEAVAWRTAQAAAMTAAMAAEDEHKEKYGGGRGVSCPSFFENGVLPF